MKSDNLQYNTVGRWVDGMLVLLSDGPTFILIDWDSHATFLKVKKIGFIAVNRQNPSTLPYTVL